MLFEPKPEMKNIAQYKKQRMEKITMYLAIAMAGFTTYFFFIKLLFL
jgi:hypothetical protein